LALDELENTNDHKAESNDIGVVYDDRIKQYMETNPSLVVDFKASAYGEGFVVGGGSTC
jgi:Fe-S cluster assembly iron-binding protein IscA